MEITVNNRITIQDVPQDLMLELESKLSFTNPKWLENEKRGFWNGETARTLKFYESDNGKITLPRGFIRQLIGLCRRYNIEYQITDARRSPPAVSFSFNGELRPYQEKAVSDVLSHDFGTLSAPTGSGKTVMCLYLITQRRQPALIVVHTRELQNQWVSRIKQFLGIPANEVGVIGNGKKQIGEKITVALVQTLYKCSSEVAPHIGYLIVDEVHRAPARCFSEAISFFDSKYMTGLSATVFRRDGLSKLIYWALGDQVHKIESEDLIETGDILKAEVIVRETNFDTRLNASEEYSKMLSELTQDTDRNKLIVRDIAREASNGGGTCLVLSDRKNHCEEFKTLLRSYGIKADVLTGDVRSKDREEIVRRLDAGKIKVLISTTQLLSEGFDSKELSTLFLGTPIKFSGRILQTTGRILRPMAGKQAKLYDYVDSKVGVLRASAKARQRVYVR